MKRTGPTNLRIKELVSELNKLAIEQKADIWKRIAKDLSKPTRIRRNVNLSRINRYAKQGEDVVVPGKVLASGELAKKLKITALSFSESAIAKIKESGSEAVLLKDYIKQNPKGSKTRIIG